MSFVFPTLDVCPPTCCQSLSVFPIRTKPTQRIDYRMSHEALDAGTLKISEVNKSGIVPELFVSNSGSERVLFIEGEELSGAKQNRVLNTSVLFSARHQGTIPVSCVEQGRWLSRSEFFRSSGRSSSILLRRILKESVSHSIEQKQGHRSDQRTIWREVTRKLQASQTCSVTNSMSEIYDAVDDRIAEFCRHLTYPEGSSGFAIALGSKVVTVDVFDKPETCEKEWDRLLSGFILDALEVASGSRCSEIADVRNLVSLATNTRWACIFPAGEGEEFRCTSKRRVHGSALCCQGVLLHGSLIAAY